MELYNFFSETTTDKNKIIELMEIENNLIDECVFIELVAMTVRNGRDKGKFKYTLIGQIWGDDTNIGDTTLCAEFGDIKYTWFDANMHSINNLSE